MDSPRIAPQATKPFPARQSLIQIFGIVSVDLIRFYMIPVIPSLIMAWYFYDSRNIIPGPSQLDIARAFHALLGIVSFIAGLVCINDDLDRGTLQLLRVVPISPGGILTRKLISAILLVVLYVGLCQSFYWVAQLYGNNSGSLLMTLSDFKDATAWNLGASFSLSFAIILGLITTGLAAGAWFSNFVYAAIAGLMVYVGWFALGRYAFQFLESTGRQQTFHNVMALELLALCAMAGYSFIWAMKGKRFSLGEPTRKRAGQYNGTKTFGWSWRVPWETHTSPWGRRMLVTAIIATAFISFFFWYLPEDSSSSVSDDRWLILLIPSAILGVSAFDKNELVGYTGLIYFQPVSRRTILTKRLSIMILYLFLAALPVLAFHKIGFNFVLIIPWISLCVGTAYLGVLSRLFYRNPIFPLILTVMLSLGAAIIFLQTARLYGETDITWPELQRHLPYAIWCSVIVLVLPWAALRLAYQKSDLLATSEKQRALLGLSILSSLAILGGILLSAQPQELAFLIFNDVRSALVHLTGAAL